VFAIPWGLRRRRIEKRELGRVGLSENDCASETQRGNDIGVGGSRFVVCECLAACQCRHARDVDDVFDTHRHAMKRAAETACSGLAIELFGFRPCGVTRDMAPCLQLRVSRIDLRQIAVDQSARAQRSRPKVTLQLRDFARMG
jgi:hypothetical protein